ncbi:hypothetical protein ADICYQ_5071 [Cyclobacterium qasimii M12-11B]|uniref:Tetratricopeptide repeat protein n=3 Tax=Cyclobacterium qasimii TaxID=1350429 RepID=S7V7L3_9BACT|nr:hypothetical protein ADICYQ_5071 [Cyclobacterium qasimii M12-11B]GEO23168.1 hypothetical protein CQA01_37020 [Cyclobacterium qasimii]
MELNRPKEAIAAFQRVLFFGDEDFQKKVFPNIAECYFLLEDYATASRYFDLAYFSASTDTTKTNYTFKKIESLVREKSFLFAKVELLNLPDNLPPTLSNKKLLYSGIIHYGLGEYDESKASFLQIVSEETPQMTIIAAFSKLEKVAKISPKKARIMSMIVPGLGQFYAGDVRNGINSLVLNGSFAYLTLQTMFNYSIWDAAISILPWYQRYHMGGYLRAEEAAYEKIRRETGEIFQEIIVTVASAQPTSQKTPTQSATLNK